MVRAILAYGFVAGGIVGGAMYVVTVPLMGRIPPALGMVVGYTTMLIALSTVFVAIKRRRDHDLGGVIRFWPALGLGVAISVVAGVCYVAAWEAALAAMGGPDAFIDGFIAQTRESGGDATAIRQMEEMRVSYRNPLFRLPITFTEIAPVGLLVSLVSAALLRNPRFLPARRDASLAG